jgi:hypothetical protein
MSVRDRHRDPSFAWPKATVVMEMRKRRMSLI